MDKRIIEETPSSEVLNDDWFIKDSPTNGTSKILGSNLKSIISGDVEDAIDKILDSIATEWRANESYSNGTYVMYEGELYECFVNGSTVGQFKKNTEWLHRTVKSMVTDVIRMIAQRFYASTVSPPSITPYSKGDLVWYSQPYHEDELYICKQDLPNGDTEWVPEHWDKVTDISGLSKYLMDKIAEAGQIDDVQVKTTGDYESVVDNKVAKIDLSNILIEKSVPNLPQSIATFNDGSDLPLKSLTASIEPQQEGSGDPSPSNVRPISGWTGCEVNVTGVNIWDEEWESGLIDHTTGNKTTGNGICSKNYISVKADTNYYAHIPIWYRIAFFDANKIFISGVQPSTNIFTTPTNAKYMKLSTNALYGTTYNNDISINYPSTDTEYHAYNGTTTTIPFVDGQGQSVEVFGGSVDVVNGGEQPRTFGSVDLGTLNWFKGNINTAGTGRIFYVPLTASSPMKQPSDNGFCEAFKYNPFSNWSAGQWEKQILNGITVTGSYSLVACVPDIYSSASDFKTAMNGVQLVYELATPTTFYTPPTSIKSLDGENNVFASTGDVTKLDYIANATDVIANLEARVTALES